MQEVFEGIFILFLPILKIVILIAPLGLIPLVLLLVRAKKYKQTAYYRDTNKPYLPLRHDAGAYGEYLIYHYLTKIDGEKRFLFNCYIPKEDGTTTEIDVIMIHSAGIFVFESKNYGGWVFGTETQKTWTQTLPAGRAPQKNHFLNPIMQNKAHITHLKKYIESDRVYAYHSLIVFSERCELKDIKLTSGEHRVMKRDAVCRVVDSIIRSSEKTLSSEEMDAVYRLLYPLTQTSELQKVEHVRQIQNKRF